MDEKEQRIADLKNYLEMLYRRHERVPVDVRRAINDRIEKIKKGEV